MTALLVVAKAPVVRRAKTRLGADVGMEAAADLAAAALLDTLAASNAAFGSRYLALDGDLDDASLSAEVRAALTGWHVFAQSGDGFGERLAHAHAHVAAATGDAVLQIGMDTPQVTAELLLAAAAPLEAGTPVVVGPATDGGWWALGLDDGYRAAALVGVAMSTAQTCDATVRALTADGAVWVETARLTDVDTVADARTVAAEAPGTRFARCWTSATAVAP